MYRSVLGREMKRSTTPCSQLLLIPARIDHRFTIRTLVGKRIGEYVDGPVAINITIVTALGTIEGRLVGRLSLSSGSGGRHFLMFSLDRDNRIVLQVEYRLATDGGYDRFGDDV